MQCTVFRLMIHILFFRNEYTLVRVFLAPKCGWQNWQIDHGQIHWSHRGPSHPAQPTQSFGWGSYDYRWWVLHTFNLVRRLEFAFSKRKPKKWCAQIKFSLSEKATKICAIVLMVLMFTKGTSMYYVSTKGGGRGSANQKITEKIKKSFWNDLHKYY